MARAAVTGATPKHDLTVQIQVPPGSLWWYFIEVNVSGDFNTAFPALQQSGAPDPQGNGQPSLIYKGQIKVQPGAQDSPKLIGRTDQYLPLDHIISDLTGITDARELLTNIEVNCRPPK